MFKKLSKYKWFYNIKPFIIAKKKKTLQVKEHPVQQKHLQYLNIDPQIH